jgi:hypothetical protein
MADRYWVGGAGTWDATTTTNWSDVSGGAGGFSAPTSVDNVIFNSASNAAGYAVTVGTNANAQDITIAGPASGSVTITSGATAVINCYGSWTSAATGVVFTTTTGATINFLATTTGKTITTNTVTLGAMLVVLNGVGGGWTLGSAFTATNTFTVTAGAFSTSASNHAFTPAAISSSNSNVRSILLNASTVTLSGASPVVFTTATNLTFDAGTSTITCSTASPTFGGGGQTFYNVTFSSTATGTTTINGTNTFNVLTQAAQAAAGLRFVTLGADQTIGTLTLSAGASAVTRTFVRSSAVGTQRTLTVATLTAISDVDFRDIVAAGASAASPWTGTRLGNCKNNSNITFAAGTDKYWSTVSGASASWSGTAWATSTGGAPALNNFPLAQDTCIIDDSGATTGNGLRTGNTITIDASWNMGTLNFSGRTVAFNWTQGNQDPVLYGDVTLTTAMTMTTVTGTPTWTFSNQGTVQALNSAGLTIRLSQITVNSPGGGVSLTTNTTLDLSPIAAPNVTGTFSVLAGTLNLSNNTLSTVLFNTSTTQTNALAFGTGNITVRGTGTIFAGSTTTTVTGTPLVICTNSSATSRTITPGAVTEANSISFRITGGTGQLVLTAGAFRDLDFTDGTNPTGFAGAITNTAITVYGNLKCSTSGMVQNFTTAVMTFAATSGTKTITTADVFFDRPFTFNGVGGTWTMQDALTLGSTRALTMTNGTLKLASGTTNTVGTFVTSGTNQKFLQSSTPGSQATLSQATGTVSVSYLTIQDNAATGGATWIAYVGNLNVDAGNNTGWLFFNNVYTREFNDSATVTDSTNVAATFNAAIADTATLSDSTSSAFLWNLIDDAQTPNWQNISSDQLPGWQDIDTL